MTDIQTVLLSQLNRSLVGSEMARDIDEVLIERFRAAKQAYRSLPNAQVGGKVEQQRQQLLNRIAMLQSETFFKVSSDTALTKMIPNILIPYLIDQGAAAYEARSVQDLRVLELNLQQFQTVLDKAINRTEHRRKSRGQGILGSIGALFVIAGLVAYGNQAGIDKNWIIPILSVPVTIVLWSLIGSLAAMLYRFNKADDLDEPLRWLCARPVTGMVMGTIVYLMIKGTLILSSSQIPISTLGSQEVMWLIAFLSGFSDRFCDFVLNLVVGRLTGVGAEAKPEARVPESLHSAPSRRSIQLLDELSYDRINGAMAMPAPPRPKAKPAKRRPRKKAAKPPQPDAVEPGSLPVTSGLPNPAEPDGGGEWGDRS